VGTVFACAIVFGSLHFGAEEVCRGTAASRIYVEVFVVVAHFDPIGRMGVERPVAMAASIDSMRCDRSIERICKGF
jgi:hypothetical protein